MSRTAECHPERVVHENGLCRQCYYAPSAIMPSGDVTNKDRISAIRNLGNRDLLFFIRDILGNGWINETEHRELCNFLMEGHKDTILPEEKWSFSLKKGENLYRIVACPRDTLKTTVCSQGYPLWRIARGERDLTVLLDSEVRDNSKARLQNIESLVDSTWLFKACYGEWRDKSRTWNESEMTVAVRKNISIREHTFETAGIDVVKNSRHYQLLIADDLHSLLNSQTQDQIDKVSNHIKDIQPLISRSGEFLLVCTWWADNDANRAFMEKMKGRIKVFQRSTYLDKAEKRPRYPHRNPIPYLEEKKDSMGIDLFNSQYRLDPVSSENRMFALDDIQIVDHREVPKNLRRYLLCDPAGDQTAKTEEKRDSDNWAIGVVAVSPANGLYLLDISLGKMKETEAVEDFIKFFMAYRPHVIGIEKAGLGNTGQHLREELRKRGHFAIVEDIKPAGRSKVMRISWLEPIVRNRRFSIVDTCPHKNHILDEFTRQTRTGNKSGHDDAVDMIAYTQDMIKKYGTSLEEKTETEYDDVKERLAGLNQISRDHWFGQHQKKNRSRENWVSEWV